MVVVAAVLDVISCGAADRSTAYEKKKDVETESISTVVRKQEGDDLPDFHRRKTLEMQLM